MPSKKSKRKQRRALSESDVNLGTRRAEGGGDEAEVHAFSESVANPETKRAEEAGDEAKLQALSESDVNPGTSTAEGAGDEAKVHALSKRDDDLGTRTTENRGAEEKAHGQSETPPFTQNIHVASKIVQVGGVNTIINQKRNQDDTPKEACPSWPSSREPKKSYAQAVSGDVKSVNVSSKEIHVQAENVNITNVIHTGTGIPNTDKSSLSATTSSKSQRVQAASFLKAVDRFDRGDFILVTGKQTELRYTNSLTLIKWTAILDFDPQSRATGLLSSVESTLNKRRSLHIGSIQEQFNFSEHITNWIFMMGCADRPNTRTETEAGAWKKETNNEIDKQISLLKGFETCYTHFKFIVLWPSDTNTAKCMNFFLSKICTQMVSSVIIVDTCTDKSEISSLFLETLKQENEVTPIELGVKEICQAVNKVFANVSTETTKFRLPTKDKSSDPGISERQAQWLGEDFEILYMENKTGIEYNSKQLEKETDTFQRGGTLPWAFWYAGGMGQADIERDVTQSIVTHIKQVYIDYSTSGIITILHSPGSGGTTLSQRVLWTLKDMVPCAQMKQNSLSSVNDLVEKISCLSDRTNMPVVLLLDGEDENRILSLRRLFEREKICVIMIYVRRHCGDFDHSEESSDIFWLKENLSKREAANLKMKNAKIKNDKRQKNVEHLVKDVENDKQRSIFEFGLAAHSYEYQGIQAYVRSHLKLPETSDTPLDPWQTSLAYLSLVYFYGHTSLPCNFFTTILGQSRDENFILKKDELPQEMHEFIVKGENEARKNTVRISHYYIAKEILDQVLTRSSIIERSVSPYICNEAKKLLGTLCTGFIEKAMIVCNGNVSDMISKIMINTFIKREHRDTFEDETQERRKMGLKRPMFSHVLEDASSCAPFLERFNILEKLVASFPKEAQFRAHLGRLYVKCLPEEEQKAEENLRVAHEMSSAILDGNQNIDEIPFSKRLDIRNICHMYGNMLSQKVFKYTGKCSKDRPFRSITQDQFHAIAEQLLDNVKKACSLFLTNRDVMSPENEDCLGFVGEIHVRLMFCRFIKENGGHNSLEAFADNNDDNLGEFVNECFANIKNLFEGMCEVADAQNIEVNGQPLQEMYIDVMESSVPSCIAYKSDVNTPRARRIEIGKLMNRYCSNRSCDFLEKLEEENEINFVVDCYEKNFEKEYLSDKDLENDYRQWLRAIRHPAFSQRYSIARVLTIVQNWYGHAQQEINPKRKINAKFYNFVLSSVVGFGHFGSSGNLELLRKSQILRKELREIAKYSQCPENQIEWLGPAVSTIDRLIPGKRRFGDYDQTSLSMKQQESLEIRVGTILPSNTKPHSGKIALDLGPENRENITIHFVPRKWGMHGTAFNSCRVEFVIGFNILHGYEAFLVKRVHKVMCKNNACCNQVERRSCDKTVTCPKCLQNTDVKSV